MGKMDNMNNVALVGCGSYGKSCTEIFRNKNVIIKAFMDNYKAGQLFEGQRIIDANELYILYEDGMIDTVVIAVISDITRTVIGTQLTALGIDSSDIYFPPVWFESFSAEFLGDVCNDLIPMRDFLPTLSYLDIPVVDWCNLKCKSCGMACGLVNEGMATPFKQYAADMKQLATKFGNIESIHFMGGEPFLCKEFSEYIKVASECFPRTDLFITTNGTLIDRLSDEMFETIRKYDAMVCISFYPTFEEKIYGIVKLLEQKKVRFYISEEKKEFYKFLSFKEQDVIQTRENCPYKSCHHLQEGKIYGCGIPITAKRLSKIADIDWADKEVGCDIYSDMNGWEISYRLNSPFETCKHCIPDMVSEKWEIAGTNVRIEDYFV